MSARSMRRAREREIERERRRESRLGKKTALAAGAAAGATVLFAPAAAQAATFQVNSTADPGDGTCDTTECTLREAITAANAAAAQADDITFASSVTGTINLDSASAQIPITDSLNIQGPGRDQLAVDANNYSRIFYVSDASTDVVSISGLTLRDGSAKYGNDSYGGAVYSTPGSGQLNITDSRLIDNSAFDAAPAPPPIYVYFYGSGGAVAAIDSAGLTITGTEIADNSAGKYGGGISAVNTDATITGSVIESNQVATIKYFAPSLGGGVYSSGATLDVDATTITGNLAGNGGGVYVQDTDPAAASGVAISGSEVENNIAQTSGGGVALQSMDSPTLIENSTFSDNTAVNQGGAINFKYGSDAGDASFTLTDSTLTDNSAGGDGAGLGIDNATDPSAIRRTTFADNFASGDGGGVYLGDTSFTGAVTVDASTLSDNEARDGGGAYLRGENPITVQNTTVTGNTAREQGGGVFVGYLTNDPTDTPPTTGEVRLNNSTISGNTADGGTAENTNGAGGAVYRGYGQGNTNISSSILADSTAGGDLAQNTQTGAYNIGVLNIGFSLIETPGSAVFNTTPAASNITGTDPELGPLADNGGATDTQLPSPASPVLDGGVANSLPTDQRGQPRTTDQPGVANRANSDGTDMGSVELTALEVGSCAGDSVTPKNGTPGDDQLVGTPEVDLIRGGAGKDVVRGLALGDCLFGENGKDRLSGDNGPDRIDGGAGKDNIKGGGGEDTVTGRAGKDVVAAGGGADTVKGNGGADKLRGAEGGDNLKGGSGADRLKGAGGDDRISGGAGDDRINCGTGDDVAIAGPGDKVSANCETVK